MLEIVKYLDQPSALRMETKIYVLAHAKAADVVQRLQAILQELIKVKGLLAVPEKEIC